MTQVLATYKKGDVEKELVAEYDFGANLEEAKAKFGEAVVFSNYVRSAKITLQAAMRRWAAAGLDDATIADKVSKTVIGIAAERIVDPIAAMLNKFEALDPAAQAELIAKLKAMKK